jgi:hypothetical protein
MGGRGSGRGKTGNISNRTTGRLEVRKQKEKPKVEKKPEAPPEGDDKDRLLNIITEMKDEEYHFRSYVPIHEVRSRMEAATGVGKKEFNDMMKQMRNDKKIRLVAITDANVPNEQLKNSIPGLGETLFYVEPIRLQ